MMTRPKHCGGLGFWDIELFNLALLARQAWRVLVEPDSLSARVLKAKYFPSCDFLQAELGGAPSQIWRAVLNGRDTLKQGIIWRVGDGQSTNIWQHNWIPRASYMRSIDPPYLQSSNWTTYCLRPNLQVICTAYLSLSARLFPPIICWSYSLQHGNDGWIFTSYKCMLKLLLTARKWWVNAFYLHQFCSIFQIVYLFLMERRSPPQPLG